MIILQLDEPGLLAYRHHDDVQNIEAIDIEHELREAYDETGAKLEVEWIEPNRYSSFGPFKSAENGRYRLVPSGIKDTAALCRLILEAPYIDPPELEGALNALAQRLRSSTSP